MEIEKLPLVSVGIATYNRSKLLSKCVRSIVDQSYPNLEVIIVDDCSADDTVEVIESLKRRDNRVRAIYHKKNMGLSHARNTFCSNALGKYLCFMDDDDYWIYSNKIEDQVREFESDVRLGICCTQILKLESKQEVLHPKIFPKNIIEKILKGNGIIHTSTVMVPKNVFDKVGGFDTYLSRGIDSDFYRNILSKHMYKIKFIDKPTAFYDTSNQGRITTRRGYKEAVRLMWAHLYLLWKYKIEYIKCPRACASRLKAMFVTPIKIVLP